MMVVNAPKAPNPIRLLQVPLFQVTGGLYRSRAGPQNLSERASLTSGPGVLSSSPS